MLLRRCYWFALRSLRGTRYQHLFAEIDKSRPKTLVEIGTWNGDNALKMIKAASKHRAVSEIIYYGFDLFEEMTDSTYVEEVSKRPPSMEEVRKLLEATGAKIYLFRGDTNVMLPQVLQELPAMDLVFIDGGHSVRTIQNDWEQISPYMSPSTIVIFDDYWSNRSDAGCKPVVESIDLSKYQVAILPTMDQYANKDFGYLEINLVKVWRR